MKIIKKYTIIQLRTEKLNDTINAKLSFGEIEGPYYDQIFPEEEFDTEEDAIKYAYKFDKYARWIIVPLIRFDYDD